MAVKKKSKAKGSKESSTTTEVGSTLDSPPDDPSPEALSSAIVLSAGGDEGKPAIELHLISKNSGKAMFVSPGSKPRETNVVLMRDGSAGKWTLQCRIRNKKLVFKPEEVVRQWVINTLIDEFGYSNEQIAVEHPVQMGSTVHSKPADVVVFTDSKKTTAHIVVELKKPGRKDGIEQLKSYMNPLGAPYGWWDNGADHVLLLRQGINDFSKPIWRLPKKGESLADIDNPITKKQLEPVEDLYAVLSDLEQNILAHQSLDTFDEIFKVVFAKLYDERQNMPDDDSPAAFRIGLSEEPESACDRVRKLFGRARNKWKDVYGASDEIGLNDENLAYCIRTLQGFSLMRSGDVLGLAFETLVNQEMKGEMGQYFTPRQVVDMMTAMVAPTLEETVCDPACGSGGFLIFTLRRNFAYINKKWKSADDAAEQRKDYAQDRLIGMDNDNRLIKVAKAYMIMENDGRGGMYYTDSLDFRSWPEELRTRVAGRKVAVSPTATIRDTFKAHDGVDVILTNPPFAGAIKAPSTLNQYTLAEDGSKKNGEGGKGVVRAILFLERCLEMLKAGGRMAIVLPQGLFNNISDQRVRDFVSDKARILAVVGLHPYTFKPFTLAKTSVLILQKWREGEDREANYPIFTAVSMRPGKNKLGLPIYRADTKALDCDMPEIADAYLNWLQSLGKAP